VSECQKQQVVDGPQTVATTATASTQQKPAARRASQGRDAHNSAGRQEQQQPRRRRPPHPTDSLGPASWTRALAHDGLAPTIAANEQARPAHTSRRPPLAAKMGLDFCNETDINRTLALMVPQPNMKSLYVYLCPVVIFVCFFSIIFNAILMSISRQSKFINKSPILLLSLNLAVTDLIASVLNGLNILFNSYLPNVFNIRMGRCVLLTMELFRCSALLASALHLLALAFVHYRGTVNPLHYR
jgi:hypothetical protein